MHAAVHLTLPCFETHVKHVYNCSLFLYFAVIIINLSQLAAVLTKPQQLQSIIRG